MQKPVAMCITHRINENHDVLMWTLCQGHLKKGSHETSNKYCSL